MNSIHFQMEKSKNRQKKFFFFAFFRFSAFFKGVFPEIRMDSESCQDKIRFDRIVRKHDPEYARDLQCGGAVGSIAAGQIEFPCDPVHVRIQRNDQMRCGDPGPSAGIHCIVTYQPAEHQIQPFACTAAFRRGQKR